MQLTQDTIKHLIQEELVLRQNIEAELVTRKIMVSSLLTEFCEADSQSYLSREELQDFIFLKLTGKNCRPNIPFMSFMNALMPELGYPLGFAHTKVRVYRGIKWKVKP